VELLNQGCMPVTVGYKHRAGNFGVTEALPHEHVKFPTYPAGTLPDSLWRSNLTLAFVRTMPNQA